MDTIVKKKKKMVFNKLYQDYPSFMQMISVQIYCYIHIQHEKKKKKAQMYWLGSNKTFQCTSQMVIIENVYCFLLQKNNIKWTLCGCSISCWENEGQRQDASSIHILTFSYSFLKNYDLIYFVLILFQLHVLFFCLLTAYYN